MNILISWIVFQIFRQRRPKTLSDDQVSRSDDYQTHSKLHREVERVHFPISPIPVFNPSFSGSLSYRSDPTHSMEGDTPVIEMQTWDRSVYFDEVEFPLVTLDCTASYIPLLVTCTYIVIHPVYRCPVFTFVNVPLIVLFYPYMLLSLSDTQSSPP